MPGNELGDERTRTKPKTRASHVIIPGAIAFENKLTYGDGEVVPDRHEVSQRRVQARVHNKYTKAL